MPNKQERSILITVDVEDWFQVENFKPWISYGSWDIRELRVEKNCHRLMDLFDDVPGVRVRATFFILGWIALRLPGLVKEIERRGHEVASHGLRHELCTRLARKDLLTDLIRSRKLLEDITGNPVKGYRAPSFAINNEILELVEKSGYAYDSSYNSFDGHGRYGSIDIAGKKRKGIAIEFSDGFCELPVSNLVLKSRVLPLGGGGYFRLLPFLFFKRGIQYLLRTDNTFVFYMHPWEIDSNQPRVGDASMGFRFRHYVNLERTEHKLRALITSFRHCDFMTCSNLLDI